MGRHAKKINRYRWEPVTFFSGGLSAGTSAANIIAAASDPQTMMRFRGELCAFLDSVQAPAVGVDVAVGVILVPQGQGSTVIWSPISDANAPWLWYERFFLGHEESVVDVLDQSGLGVVRKTIDSKAMRIQRSDVEIQLVAEQASIGTGSSINVSVRGRMLFGLS